MKKLIGMVLTGAAMAVCAQDVASGTATQVPSTEVPVKRIAVFVQNRTRERAMDDEIDGIRDRLAASLAAVDGMEVLDSAQIADTFRKAYPNGRLLYPGPDDFSKAKRVEFFNKIANNDWDCIIMTHDQFGRIPLTPEVQDSIAQDEIAEIDAALEVMRQVAALQFPRSLIQLLLKPHY